MSRPRASQSSGRRHPRAIAAWVIGLLAMTLQAVGCGAAHATESYHEGRSPLVFSAVLLDSAKVGGEVQLRVIWFCDYSDSAVGRATIVLPSGWSLISGDTARVLDLDNQTMPWVIRMLPTGAGTVRGVSTIEVRGASQDESEWEATIIPDSTAAGSGARKIREEMVREGQRYRYAGFYLVPIDSSEAVIERDFGALGARAQVVERTRVATTNAAVGTGRDVRLVVITNADGSVFSVRPYMGVDGDDPIVQTAMAGVLGWQFEPARLRGRGFRDWLEIRVHVEPSE